jgi:hypothetical protein
VAPQVPIDALTSNTRSGSTSGLRCPVERHGCGGPMAHAKMAAAPHNATMDIERVNAIGTLLTDLAARTAALRGYL